MLDLTDICGSLYEIKLADGIVYKLKRPTQGLYEAIIRMGKLSQGDKTEELMSECLNVLVRILNRNTEGKEFTLEQVEEDYDFAIAMMVMSDYMQFYADEISNRVNFRVAQ